MFVCATASGKVLCRMSNNDPMICLPFEVTWYRRDLGTLTVLGCRIVNEVAMPIATCVPPVILINQAHNRHILSSLFFHFLIKKPNAPSQLYFQAVS